MERLKDLRESLFGRPARVPSCVFKDTVAAITRTTDVGIAIFAEALGAPRGGADCAAGGVEILRRRRSRRGSGARVDGGGATGVARDDARQPP